MFRCLDRSDSLIDVGPLVARYVVRRLPRAKHPFGGFARNSVCPLAAGRRHLRLFVFVVGVARRTPGLLHLIVNHRHDGMVGDTSFPRTVVIEDVTEAKPALLH
jgi:hypothetical protein